MEYLSLTLALKFLTQAMQAKKILFRPIWVLGLAYTAVFDETSKMTFGLDIHKLMVPTPPLLGDSIGMVEYRNKSVVSSWFTSFADAPGGFSEELKEFQFSVGTEFWYMNQFALRGGILL
jgi:hypothetical protein